MEIHAGASYVEPIEGLLTALGAQVHVPLRGMTQGEHLAWYLNNRPADRLGGRAKPPLSKAAVSDAVHTLSESTPLPAATFPWGRPDLDVCGMYAWWVDVAGASELGLAPAAELTLVYTGQAGATHWPSGKRSDATLLSRIRQQHLRGTIRSSTLRQTFAALLRERLGLVPVGDGRLDPASESLLSTWLTEHLFISVWPWPDGDALAEIEEAVNRTLDAPLNLRGAVTSDVRRRLAEGRVTLRRFGSD